MAWFEVCHGWIAWRPMGKVLVENARQLLGFIAFGVSAVASYVTPATGELRNALRANLGTQLGAVRTAAGAWARFWDGRLDLDEGPPGVITTWTPR